MSIFLLTNCYSQVIHLDYQRDYSEKDYYNFNIKIGTNVREAILTEGSNPVLWLTTPTVNSFKDAGYITESSEGLVLEMFTIGNQTLLKVPFQVIESSLYGVAMTTAFLNYFGKHIFDKSASLLIMLEDQNYMSDFRNVGNGHWKPYLIINFINEDCLLYDDPNLSTSVKFLKKGETVSLWEKNNKVSIVGYGKDMFYIESRYLIEIEIEVK